MQCKMTAVTKEFEFDIIFMLSTMINHQHVVCFLCGLITLAVASSTIRTVYVMWGNHLDVGFDAHNDPPSGLAIDVINAYFTQFFPRAINTSATLAAQGIKYVYTTHPWLIDLYLRCPAPGTFPGTLACPDASQLSAFKDAIKKGWISWHAAPFNGEPEVYDVSLFRSALSIARRLDEQFGRPRTLTMSQRDVPGMTRGVVPILRQAGIEAISVGVNGGSSPPAVPSIFLWGTKRTYNDSIISIYHPGGYGGLEPSDLMTFPGSTVGLIANFKGDNRGPHFPQEVLESIAILKTNFPGAEIISGTFDDFVKAILPMRDALPLITEEIGDTWIHGVATDAWKSQTFREIMRIRANYCEKNPNQCPDVLVNGQPDQQIADFDRLLIKAGEHTWGLDVKTFLNDTVNWRNEDLRNHLNDPNFRRAIRSWEEQREYITYAVKALGNHPLANEIINAIAQLRPTPFDTSSYTQVLDYDKITFSCGKWKVRFGKSGGIEYLENMYNQKQYATSEHVIGNFVYQTLDEEDYNYYLKNYAYCDYAHGDCEWFYLDFGKPNMSIANPISALWKPVVLRFYARSDNDSSKCSFLVQMTMQNQTSVKYYGAPASIWVQFNISQSLSVDLRLFDKTSTRLSESAWMSFNPIVHPKSSWVLEKLGSIIDSSFIIKNGSTHLHALTGAAYALTNAGEMLRVYSVDAPLVSVGVISPIPLPLNSMPNQNSGIHFSLYNNLWGTNYPMWYPFANGDENIKYRFTVDIIG